MSIDNEFGKSDFNEYPYGHATVIKDWKFDNSTADMTADEIAQMTAELEKSLYFTVKDSNGKFITATGADGVYTYNGESATEFKYVLKNSTFTIAELPTGDYTVTEFSTLPDYTIKSENPVKITVVRNQTAKATFVNERDTGTGKVIKVWKQFDTMTAAEQTEIEKNVYFTVTDSNGAYLKVKESNGSYIYCGAQKTETKFVLKNGAFVIAELPTGEYTVTEFNNAKDYSPKQQTQKIKIAKNTAVALTFTNVRDTGNATQIQKALLTKGLIAMYEKFNITWDTSVTFMKNTDFPVMTDLYNTLLEQRKTAEKGVTDDMDKLILLLENITTGADSFLWNGHTTMQSNAQLIVFDTQNMKIMSDAMKSTQYFNLLSWCWQQMSADRSEKVMVVCDEAWLLINPDVPQAMSYLRDTEKRARKYSGALAVATQNVVDFLDQKVKLYAQPVLDLPSTKFIFGCEGDDLKAVSTLYNFTEAQRELVAAGNRAECLMKAGGRSLKLKVQLPEKRLKQLGLGGN